MTLVKDGAKAKWCWRAKWPEISNAWFIFDYWNISLSTHQRREYLATHHGVEVVPCRGGFLHGSRRHRGCCCSSSWLGGGGGMVVVEGRGGKKKAVAWYWKSTGRLLLDECQHHHVLPTSWGKRSVGHLKDMAVTSSHRRIVSQHVYDCVSSGKQELPPPLPTRKGQTREG